MESKRIKVLIVEDSPIAAKLLSYIIESDAQLEVIGMVESGEAALEWIKNIQPDVITMDIVLPGMDGFEATNRIMKSFPIPIIIVSAHYQNEDIDKSFKAISAGALDILEKPVGPRDPNYQIMAGALIQSIKNAALIKFQPKKIAISSTKKIEKKEQIKPSIDTQAVAIGASLGGPRALQFIFSKLAAEFPCPILLVQHISAGYTQGLVDWLQKDAAIHIKLAEHEELAKPGWVYIAPENTHLEAGPNQTILLSQAPPEGGLRPSVSRLFRSMAHRYGPHGLGIILTGMGRDGARDLLLMKQQGAVTIAQSQESSLVFGMPGEAIAMGGVGHIMSLQEISDYLNAMV